VGSAIGVAIFGAVVNGRVSSRLGTANPDLSHVSASVLEPAVHAVFVVSLLISVALLLVGSLMPKHVTEPEPGP
jgi:hypothetical protein